MLRSPSRRGSSPLRALARTLALVAACLLLAGCTGPRVVLATAGVLDLGAWDPEDVIVPHGEYRLQDGTLDFDDGRPSELFRIPGNIGSRWPSRGVFGMLQGGGCAVLSLELRLPDAPSGVVFALDGIHARVRARSLDGDRASNEVVAAPLSCDPSENVEVQHGLAVMLPRARHVRVEVALSPQLWGRANVNGSFRLGSPSAMMRQRATSLVQLIGSIGVLVGLVGAATVLALMRRDAEGAKPLAIFLAILAGRATLGLRLFEGLWPTAFTYTVTLTAEYLAMPLGVATGFAFFDATIGLPRSYRPWVFGGAAVSAVAIVLAPQAYMTGPVANATKAFTAIATLSLVPHGLRWRDPTERKGTWIMRGGIVALVLGTVIDVWRSVYAPFSEQVMPIATVLFAFSQASLVSLRHAAALATAERLLADVDDANAELQAHGDRVDEFLQHASAELVEPASAVVALAEGTTVAHGRRLGDDLRHAFELIAQNGRRIAFLASEIGDMSRREEAGPPSEPNEGDAEVLTRRALEIIRPLLAKRKLEVRIAAEERLPVVFGDLHRIERAIASMIGFGATYAESEAIAITLAGDGGSLVITVAVNGRFPDPGPLASPFETVRRLAGAGLPATRLGVGLSTAHRTALQSGGELRVRVTNEVGAMLTLRLPGRSPVEGSGEGEPPRSARVVLSGARLDPVRPSSGGRAVLVVEDDETSRTLVRQVLERCGFDAWLAADGESAIETIVSAGPPDIVVLDLGLPGLSGHQVLDALRQRFDAATLPVLVLSARGFDDDVAESFRRGANDHIVKPVKLVDLEARVTHHAELVQAHRRMKSELELRRRYEGKIERVAQRASEAERTTQAPEARADGHEKGEAAKR